MIAKITKEQIENLSKEDLIIKRDKIISSIKKFENKELSSEEYLVKPSPQTIYLFELEDLITIINELIIRNKNQI